LNVGTPGLAYAGAMTRLRALWLGELPLREAFWTYAVAIALVVNLTTTLLLLALLLWEQPWAALFVGYALAVPYNVLALVGVWRSAARYQGPRVHADLARIVTVIGLTILSLT
jgi:hypothetical protein